MKTVNFTHYPITLCSYVRRFTLGCLLLVSQMFLIQDADAQCAVGWNRATANWDNLDYLTTTNLYTGFVSPAQEATQNFAIGRNRFSISFAGLTNLGDDILHTGEAGSYSVQAGYYGVSSADVHYQGNGTITITFDSVVQNVKFSLYDIDGSARAQVTAVDAASAAVNVTLSPAVGTWAASNLVPTPVTTPSTSVATNPRVDATATNALNTANSNTVNVDIAGNVKSITITLSNNTIDPDFWLSDISACVYGSFPNNYYVVAKPFTGQPAYVLNTPDSNTVTMIDLATGVSKFLFRDASATTYVNSLGYDPYNHILYYVKDGTAGPASNRALKKYDYNTGTISTVVADINTLGIPAYDRGVEGGGGAFYNGSFFLGVEANSTNNTNANRRETAVWRIDFDALGNATKACQVYATPSDSAKTTNPRAVFNFHDWSDFVIKDGVLYDYNLANQGNKTRFSHYSMQADTMLIEYYTNNVVSPKQSGIRWDGQLYWFSDSMAVYNGNGTIGPRTKITPKGGVTARLDWVGFSGDGSEAFKPKTDFGDAPASYDPSGSDPATHEFDSTLKLGPTFDDEWINAPGVAANGDGADEDCIVGPSPIFTHFQSGYKIPINVLNKSGANATVAAWIDFNNDGVFAASEGITVNVVSNPSSQNINLVWTGKPFINIAASSVYVRIRITSAANGMTVSNPNGYYMGGEVEDWKLLVDDILPVSITNFTAKAVNTHTVNIDWQSAQEVKVKTYTIQRSSNATVWTDLLDVQPKNDGSPVQNYKSQDKDALGDISYYRLKMTDMSGEVTYSAIRLIDMRKERPIAQVFPNPFTSTLQVTYTLPTPADAEVRLLDYSGRVVKSLAVQARAGQQTTVFEGLSNLAKGYYVIEIIQNGIKIFNEKVSRQ